MQKSKMFFEDFEVGLVIKTGSKKLQKKKLLVSQKTMTLKIFILMKIKQKKVLSGHLSQVVL